MSDNIASLGFAKDQLVTPDNDELNKKAIQRWSETAVRRAKYIVLAETAEDVSKVNKLDLTIKGGGHSCSGTSLSEGGLVVDLSRMNQCVINLEQRMIKVGGGMLWSDVDTETAKYGMATVGGTVNHTGVGGFTVGGGYGWLTPCYGLIINNLEEAEVVTANGKIVTCNETKNGDLSWGIRGASSNFGPAMSFTFKLFLRPNPIWAGLLMYPPLLLTSLFDAAAKWEKIASVDESALIFFGCPAPAFTPMLVVILFYNGSAQEGREKFAPFFALGPISDMTREMPYPELGSDGPLNKTPWLHLETARLLNQPPSLPSTPSIFRSYSTTMQSSLETCRKRRRISSRSTIIFELHPFSKITAIPESATTFSNQGNWYNLIFVMRWTDPAQDKQVRTWASEQVDFLRGKEEQGVQPSGRRRYGNYAKGDEKAPEVYRGNFECLAQLKGKYNPDNVFHKWFAIPPKP
ncbi:FAD-binding domain-containing protein [Calocera cornea HHB12733]|uniref:FAD-binding domain-containing protein n=1 Tax=Calocera cornea HHB12733 TaxID=1353952 RepID=A0A165DS33_9BASI|nr:FAD-binding domain-containing protein [Calocera cornea HHB12733]